ncbi:MAG TPA: hypothetical protein VN960_00530 [Gaiellaceae bacterium]|nr:hypothetical protein [Gaiellaceae bacterium]
MPDTTVVTTLFAAPRMSVRAVASAKSFVALPELPAVPVVLRLTSTPPTDSVSFALTIVVPAVPDVKVIVQLPVPPEVVHGFAVVNDRGPLTIVKLICVPSGAFAKPEPLFTLTCAVNTWFIDTGLTAEGGAS